MMISASEVRYGRATLAACVFALALTHAPRAWSVSLWAPFPKGRLTRSDTCGSCHKDIYRMWKASAHANAMEDNIFQDAFREVESRDPAVSRRCLECHAPAIAVNSDRQLEQKVTWEGVSCDICHSLTAVDPTGSGPRLAMSLGPVKRGPIKDASSMAHETLFSELHTTSLVCAGCHEYASPEGVPVITTYTEWKGSAKAKEGSTCQSCHMGRVHANAVDPKIKRVQEPVNLHEMPGGHSLDQLHKALELSIQPKRDGDKLRLQIGLLNKGAGHAVPTGMPGRSVILDLGVQTSLGQSYEEKRVYAKRYQDRAGKPIVRDGDYFFNGVRLISDSRIQPGEKRTESFEFPVGRKATAFLTLKLHYEHSPTGGTENRTWITFQSETRTLLPENPTRR